MMLVSDLAGGDVTLGVRAGDFDLINSLIYSSDHALSLLASGDAVFTASVQNSGTGAVNVVAGWDGTTLDSAHFGDSGVSANGNGSVTIGGAQAAGNVAVGSAGGTTLVAGQDITLGATNGYAQAGFHGSGTGAIQIFSNGLLSLTASGGGAAQVGNGGTDVTGDSSGDITVHAGNIALSATATYNIAAIGNIGAGATASQSGTIDIFDDR